LGPCADFSLIRPLLILKSLNMCLIPVLAVAQKRGAQPSVQ
jgi:hypothetical protein